MNKTLIGATLAAMLLTACATTPPKLLSAPPSASGGYTLARAPGVDVTSHMVRHLDKDKNILYTQAAGGGGVGMGLLLGPLGVLANVKMIETRTGADVALLNDKVAVLPRALFAEAVQKNGLVLGSAPQSQRATPYLYIAKSEGDKLLVFSSLIMESGGADKWVGTYQYQLPVSYSVAELSSLDGAGAKTLRDAAADGFDRLVKRLAGEKQERIDQEQKILFHSRFLQPMLDVEMTGALIADEGEVIWVRNPGSVIALRKANIRYKLNQ